MSPSQATGRGARAALIGVALCGVGACDRVPSDDELATRAQCQQLREHVVDLRLNLDGPGISSERAAVLAKHRENLVASRSDAYLDECSETRTVGYVSCALSSKTLDDLRKCE